MQTILSKINHHIQRFVIGMGALTVGTFTVLTLASLVSLAIKHPLEVFLGSILVAMCWWIGCQITDVLDK